MRRGAIEHVEKLVEAAATRYGHDRNARAALTTFDAAVAALRSLPAAPGSRIDLARQRVIDASIEYRAQVLAGRNPAQET
ncbi:MAG: hypothetical protein KIS91_16165 [Anaerolineae bacterium]|nr:hypothetical protein [Anaerolineae bacterium]